MPMSLNEYWADLTPYDTIRNLRGREVAVAYREPAWDVYGTIRYWVYDDRSLAEARYLELQRLFGDLDEAITMKALERNQPPVEAHWHHEE